LIGWAVPAGAQTAYDVESDRLEIFNREGRAIFEGDVRLWNDTTSIQCNHLEVFYVGEGDTIDYLEAYGNVEVKRDTMYASARYAYHDVENDTALLQEDAYVRRDGSEFWADRIRINMITEQIRMRDDVRGRLVETPDTNARERKP
jgi:lipopolysaccharide transport protein LptA